MTLAKLNCKKLILVDEKNCDFIDGVFDGINYYFLEKCKPIVKKYKKDLQEFIKIKTEREYKNICYDYMENCFWACTLKDKDIIYKINMKFEEIDKFQIKSCIDLDVNIINLSYCRQDDSLIIITEKRIIQIDKCGEILKNIYENSSIQCNYYCSKIDNSIVYLSKIKSCSYIGISDKWNNKKIFRLPKIFSYSSILSVKRCSKKMYVILLVKDCKKNNYIIKVTIHIENIQNLDECLINYRNSLNIALNAISIIETELGDIIKCESEKLKKAIKVANSTEELIEVNKEVNKTIINITSLENIMYSRFLEIEQIQNKLINKIYSGE